MSVGVTEWKHGVYAGIDTEYPRAFEELVARFKILGSQELMARCSIPVSTNQNESMHQRLHTIVNKNKKHGLQRILFAAKQVMLNSNFGHEAASMANVFGTLITIGCT